MEYTLGYFMYSGLIMFPYSERLQKEKKKPLHSFNKTLRTTWENGQLHTAFYKHTMSCDV